MIEDLIGILMRLGVLVGIILIIIYIIMRTIIKSTSKDIKIKKFRISKLDWLYSGISLGIIITIFIFIYIFKEKNISDLIDNSNSTIANSVSKVNSIVPLDNKEEYSKDKIEYYFGYPSDLRVANNSMPEAKKIFDDNIGYMLPFGRGVTVSMVDMIENVAYKTYTRSVAFFPSPRPDGVMELAVLFYDVTGNSVADLSFELDENNVATNNIWLSIYKTGKSYQGYDIIRWYEK
ncbi:hypothetical protein [Fusobacterium nucleatum]|uniref:hypothetical protein n=1 Tax=Fusobacterium nucleatum TaxID=851 RepID=UPI0030D37F44